MKCKVLCLLLCVLFCFSCFSLSSSAVSPYDTPEYLLQRGWVFDESDGSYYLPSGVVDSYISSFPANMMAATPYYPTFDINRLPWQAAPDNVLKYINMVYSYPPDVVPHVPFICVRVSANSVHVYVGYNLGFGYDSYYDRYLICTTYPSNSVCYSATFRRSNYSVYEDWHQLSCSDLGDTGRVYAYTPTLAYAGTSEYDFYFSGGSGLKSYSAGNGWTSLSYIIRSANDYPVFFYCDSALGFAKGYFAYYQNNTENINYYQYFRPLTSSQQQIQQNQQIIDGQQEMIEKQEESNNTQKSIWETLKSIPDMISEKIKGLFIPAEGFFDTYTEEFQTYFEERLGILYELPEAVVDILQQFLTFEPATDGYYIPIPEVVLPVKLEDGTYQDFTIFEQQDYKFDFLSEGAIGTLYSFYRGFCWLVCILALIYFAIRKFEKLTGG